MTPKVIPKCGECGSPMILRESRYGKFWGCSRFPQCKGTHGAHQADGRPLGTPADKETKAARIKAHAAFDMLWKGREMSRTDAYRWMGEAMKLPPEQRHIGEFTTEQCVLLIALLAARKGGRP
jgi:ssDNA-binding Zn-finger/Zn-ribbon topoisomerase 1